MTTARLSPDCVTRWFKKRELDEHWSPHDAYYLNGCVWVIGQHAHASTWPFSGVETHFFPSLPFAESARPDLIVFHTDALGYAHVSTPGLITGIMERFYAPVMVYTESAWGEVRPCRTTLPLSPLALKVAAYASNPPAMAGKTRARGLEVEVQPFPLPVRFLQTKLAASEPGHWDIEELSPHEVWMRLFFTHSPTSGLVVSEVLTCDVPRCIWIPPDDAPALFIREPGIDIEFLRGFMLLQHTLFSLPTLVTHHEPVSSPNVCGSPNSESSPVRLSS